MKISKNSWHYRVIKFADVTVPQNLCVYFWKVVLACAWVIFAATLCLLIVGMLAYLIDYALIITFIYLFGDLGDFSYFPFFLGYFLIFLICLGFTGPYLSTLQFRRINKVSRQVQKSLPYRYLEAKHRKICPLIELTS